MENIMWHVIAGFKGSKGTCTIIYYFCTANASQVGAVLMWHSHKPTKNLHNLINPFKEVPSVNFIIPITKHVKCNIT